VVDKNNHVTHRCLLFYALLKLCSGILQALYESGIDGCNVTQNFITISCRAGPSRCGAQCKTYARGPLSSDFMTSSCSVNHVTIVVERKYAVQHWHENWARLLTFERKFA